MENYSNWAELQRDVMLTILMKLPQLNILESVQFVCKPWYDLCKDPSMWRSIKILDEPETSSDDGYVSSESEDYVQCMRKEYFYKPEMSSDDGYVPSESVYEKMVVNAVDRSAGGLIDLDIEGFSPRSDLNRLCSYVASRSTQLKRLRIACCNISWKDFTDGLPQLSSLNELDFTLCSFHLFTRKRIIDIIKSCPMSVTSFKLNVLGSRKLHHLSDKVAQAIAETLPQLRHLQLVGNGITNAGLTTILDRCSRLQSLDLRACFHINLEGDLGKTLSEKVTDLKLPYDSTKDYKYPTLVSSYYDYSSDDDLL